MQIDNNLNENDLIQQIGNNAVRDAQRKSLENGVPNVYSKNGFLYYQLTDGTITMDNPFENQELKMQLDLLIQNEDK
jgi:hypothetical protein